MDKWVDSNGNRLSDNPRNSMSGYNLVLTLPKPIEWPQFGYRAVTQQRGLDNQLPAPAQNGTAGVHSIFNLHESRPSRRRLSSSAVDEGVVIIATAFEGMDSAAVEHVWDTEQLCVACNALLTGERKFCSSCGQMQPAFNS